jgi:large subunit ribosomal protein L17
MRHRVAGRQLSRNSAHRRAMRRNMAQSLIEHETISTTIQKAKELKPFVEKLITLAKRGKLQHRRRAISLLGNRRIVALEDGAPVQKGTVIGKLFSELGPRYLDRPGGYSRIVHLSLRRLGDNGELVLLQLLGKDEPVKKVRKTASKKRSRRKAKAAAQAAKPVPAEATTAEEQPAEPAAEAQEEPRAEAAGEQEEEST